MQTIFGKLRLITHCALTLLVAVQISTAVAAAGKANHSAAKVVVHFPTDYSVGALVLYPARDKEKCRDFQPARGAVAIPPGAALGLTFNYAGAKDTSFLRHIEAPYLVALNMGRFNICDAQSPDFKNLTAVRNLNLEQTDIGDQGVQSFRNMKNLRDLDISRTMITGKSFALLSCFTRLAILNAAHNDLHNSSMVDLEALKAVEILRLGSCGLDDRALAHVGRLTKLRSLHLEANAKITDTGIAHLINLKDLHYLDLTGTKVTGACTAHLKRLTSLTELHISFAKFKGQEVESLRRALPRCQISDIRKTHDVPVEIFAPLHSPIAPRH